MNFKKLSQTATSLREHVAVIGLPIADLMYLLILIIAKIKNDWRREVDALGQLALDVKRPVDISNWKPWQEFFLNLSLNWMQACLAICEKNEAEASTLIVYQTEVASCLIDILERKIDLANMDKQLESAHDLLDSAEAHAMAFLYSSYLCRIKTKKAKLLLLENQVVASIVCSEKAFSDGEDFGTHPSHMAEALTVHALAEGRLFDDPGYTVTKLKEALIFAQRHHLVLRIKEVEKLIKKLSEK